MADVRHLRWLFIQQTKHNSPSRPSARVFLCHCGIMVIYLRPIQPGYTTPYTASPYPTIKRKTVLQSCLKGTSDLNFTSPHTFSLLASVVQPSPNPGVILILFFMTLTFNNKRFYCRAYHSYGSNNTSRVLIRPPRPHDGSKKTENVDKRKTQPQPNDLAEIGTQFEHKEYVPCHFFLSFLTSITA